MTYRNNWKIFPDLSLRTLKKYAHRWAVEFPFIYKIYLYFGTEDSKYDYIIVVICPKFPKLNKTMKKKLREQASYYPEEKLLISFYNWADPGCLHIRNEIYRFYKKEPPIDYFSEWMWFNIEPGESIPPGMVVEKYFWTLYESLNLKPIPPADDFLLRARNEVQVLYEAIKEATGVKIKGLEKGTKLRHAKAIEFFNKGKSRFDILKKEHIDKEDIFEVKSRPSREIIGCVLHEVVSKAGFESNGAQKLFERSQKLLKKKD